MTKSELILQLAETHPNLLIKDIELIVSTIFNEMEAVLTKGDRIELRGFGAFFIKKRKARSGRNPRTGEIVAVEEKYVPFFKTGKELKKRTNQHVKHKMSI
ncbi:Integration host factor subunit beta [Commensalibacter sp. Nvir]|uniref:integration host factor subunit beta n=1 Tax=Commensalibacter sp. Nvir TaxID=3069817 RepID=UPI002D6FE7C5|nr:Integration host factor subunit beta [Commensalibacter sp. Nvir]